MKKIMLMLLIVTATQLAACAGSGGGGAAKTTVSSGVRRLLPSDEFERKMADAAGAQIIDVRTPGEFALGHLANAVNINVNDPDFEQQLLHLNKSRPVLVYCKAGSRSARAADVMQRMEFTEIYELDGGIMKWENAGKPLAGSPKTNDNGMTTRQLEQWVAGKKKVLVDYHARWCEPCKRMMPELEALALAHKNEMDLLTIDADENKTLLQDKHISGIPYLELYTEGRLTWSHEGYIDSASVRRAAGL